jgi:hypothetical protein
MADAVLYMLTRPSHVNIRDLSFCRSTRRSELWLVATRTWPRGHALTIICENNNGSGGNHSKATR